MEVIDIVSQPCKRRKDAVIQVCDPKDADYFTIYKIFDVEEGYVAMAECYTRQMADLIVNTLKKEFNLPVD